VSCGDCEGGVEGCGLGPRGRGDGEEIRDRGDEEYSFCGGLVD
jgi:hypothetical protein